MTEAVKIAAFLPPKDFEIMSAFASRSGTTMDEPISFSDIRSALSGELRSRLDFLYLAADFEMEKFGNNFDIGGEIISLAAEIEKEHYREALYKINQEIKKQESLLSVNGEDGKSLEMLTKKFQDISKMLNNLNKKP